MSRPAINRTEVFRGAWINGCYHFDPDGFQKRRSPVPPVRQRVKMLLCEAGYPGEFGDRFRRDDLTDLHVPSYDELIRAHQLAGSFGSVVA